jgi:hypothetical protein
VIDAVVLIALTIAIMIGAWMCSRSATYLRPEEHDCLYELRVATRKTVNYTEDQVVSYGRCLLRQRGVQ